MLSYHQLFFFISITPKKNDLVKEMGQVFSKDFFFILEGLLIVMSVSFFLYHIIRDEENANERRA